MRRFFPGFGAVDGRCVCFLAGDGAGPDLFGVEHEDGEDFEDLDETEITAAVVAYRDNLRAPPEDTVISTDPPSTATPPIDEAPSTVSGADSDPDSAEEVVSRIEERETRPQVSERRPGRPRLIPRDSEHPAASSPAHSASGAKKVVDERTTGMLKQALRTAEKALSKREEEFAVKLDEMRNEHETRIQLALEQQRMDLIGRHRLELQQQHILQLEDADPTSRLARAASADVSTSGGHVLGSTSSFHEDFALSMWTEFVDLVHEARTEKRRFGDKREVIEINRDEDYPVKTTVRVFKARNSKDVATSLLRVVFQVQISNIFILVCYVIITSLHCH